MGRPEFISLDKKNFSDMIFEDPKQIRIELVGIKGSDDGRVVASQGNLYLEHADGSRMMMIQSIRSRIFG